MCSGAGRNQDVELCRQHMTITCFACNSPTFSEDHRPQNKQIPPLLQFKALNPKTLNESTVTRPCCRRRTRCSRKHSSSRSRRRRRRFRLNLTIAPLRSYLYLYQTKTQWNITNDMLIKVQRGRKLSRRISQNPKYQFEIITPIFSG